MVSYFLLLSSIPKKQKDRTLKDELPRSVGAQYATGDQWRNNSRKIGLSDSLLLDSYIASIPATAATLFMTPLGNDRDG